MGILNSMDIFRLQVGDKITFDGNPSLGALAGFAPNLVSADKIGVKKFITSSGASPLLLGEMSYDNTTYEEGISGAYDTVFDSTNMITEGGGVFSMPITTPTFTEGEYYLIVIDTGGIPLVGSRPIANAAIIYISHQQIPILGGSPAGVDLDSLKRLISVVGAAVKLRGFVFENGFMKENDVVIYDFDNANSISIDLADINDDTFKVASYSVDRIINNLGDVEQATSTKDP